MARDAIQADEVSRKEFTTAFRGFDQQQVRAYLVRVATELAAAHERETLLRERMQSAEARADARPLQPDLDTALGEEAARVLHAAREAAADIRSRAEEQVARLLREANDEGTRVRHEAENLLAIRGQEGERLAAELTEAAEVQAAEVRAEAERVAAAEVEAAQAKGREMVAEAQAVRERILGDLGRRRRAAHQQLEQLRAGRERLLESYSLVRVHLEEATRELTVSEIEARAAAEAAALQSSSQPEPTLAELEEEVAAARRAGLTLVPGSETEPALTLGAESLPPVEEASVPDTDAETGAAAAGADPAPAEEVEEPAPVLAERRTSALRILRRKTEPPPKGLTPVEPAAPVEGVRVIAPEPVVELPGADEATGEAAGAQAAEGAEEATGEVDELFARIRADRASTVAAVELIEADAAPAAEGTVAVMTGERAVDPDDPTVVPDPADVEVVDPEAEADEQALTARDATTEPLERAALKAVKRALSDEQNEVLDTLRRAKDEPSIESVLPPPEDHVERYAALVLPALQEAAQAGSDTGLEVEVADLAEELGTELTVVLRDRVARALEGGAADDGTVQASLSSVYREAKTVRAESLAAHAVTSAHARGRYAAAGDDASRWVVDPAEGPCPDCDDNALGGATDKGQPFPTGHLHPPAHVGCRCLLAPAHQ